MDRVQAPVWGKKALRGGNNMRLRKATVLVCLFMVCFVLAAQSAKAESIIFRDLTDSPTLSGSNRLTEISCSSVTETCTATLLAPFISANPEGIVYRLGEGSTIGKVSDTFVGGSFPGSDFNSECEERSCISLTFTSDRPNALGEANGLGPCMVPGLFPGCNAVENGTPQLVGTITWRNRTGAPMTDSIFIQSDVAPEPASLILFGSGLAIAGGFLRRRKRLVTPSV